MKQEIKKLAAVLFETTKNASEKELPEIMDAFFVVLQEKDILHQANLIIEAYGQLFDRENNSATALVETNFSLDQKQKEEIKQALESKLKKNINLKEEVNPLVLGGFKVRVEDFLIDGSLSNTILKLKQNLVA